MWLKVWENLPRHPKTSRLMALLEIPRAHAVGVLTCFWLWARQYAKSGDVSGFTPSELADAAMWHGDSVRFVGALESAGFLDPLDPGEYGFIIHDWEDYGGKDVKAAADASRRQKEKREREKQGERDVTVTSRERHAEGLPLRHATDQTRQEQSIKEETTTRLTPEEEAAKDAFFRLNGWWAKMQGQVDTYSRDWEPLRAALALPGMTVDRIARELDPIIEAKRKKGEKIGSFSYCLKVLESLVHRERVAVAGAAGGLSSLSPSARVVDKPQIQDEDHYHFLVRAGIFNPGDWANANEFEGAF